MPWGAHNANHSAEMHHAWEHNIQAIEQKCIMLGNAKHKPFCGNASCLGSQNANHSAEMQSLGEHRMQTVQQKCIMVGNTKYKPLSRNASCLGARNADHSAEMHPSPDHKMLTIQQKCRALEQRTPRRRQSGDRSTEMQRITNTVQQKCMIGKPKMATVRQKFTLTQEPSL